MKRSYCELTVWIFLYLSDSVYDRRWRRQASRDYPNTSDDPFGSYFAQLRAVGNSNTCSNERK